MSGPEAVETTIVQILSAELLDVIENDLIHLMQSGVVPTDALMQHLSARAADAFIERLVEKGILTPLPSEE